MSDDRTNTPARTHPDAAFVRRCRIIFVGLARTGALVLLTIPSGVQAMALVGAAMSGRLAGLQLAIALALILSPFFGSAAVLWFFSPWLARRVFPSPPDPTRCPKCKYPLEGLDADNCPECGTRIR